MELKIEAISKIYQKGADPALWEFSAVFTPGVYGLLGANGAGKSTLMNIITGNIGRNGGRILVDGIPTEPTCEAYLAKLGYMPQQQSLYETFTAQRFMWYMAALKKIPTSEAQACIPQLLQAVGLGDSAHKKLKTFSGGMKQRILIAQALLGNPQLLVLDEPTAGLDPKERIRIRNLIGKLGQNKIVLIATHLVSDVETIAKEVLFIQKGKLICKGAIPQLLKEMEGNVWSIPYKNGDEDTPMTTLYLDERGETRLRCVGNRPTQGEVRPESPTLEDLYLYFYGDEEARKTV